MASVGNQYAVRLACQIVREQFGELAETVARTLLNYGRLSLKELQATARLPASQLRQQLLVLMQHNLVDAWLQPAEMMIHGLRPAIHLYEAKLDWMLQGLRRPRWLVYVKDDMGTQGDVSESILEVLVEHGRLRLDQIVPVVVQRLSAQRQQQQQPPHEADGAAAPEPGVTPELVRHVFHMLVNQERYIERAPPATLAPPLSQPCLAPNKVQRRPAKTGGTADEQAERRKAMRVKRYNELRFSVPKELIFDDDAVREPTPAPAAQGEAGTQGGGDASGGGGGGGSGGGGGGDAAMDWAELTAAAAAGGQRKRRRIRAGGADADPGAAGAADEASAKRRRAAGDSSAGGGAAATGAGAAAEGVSAKQGIRGRAPEIDDDEGGPILWRINPEELNRRLRHQACVAVVRSKYGVDAATILGVLLLRGRCFETSLKQETGPVISLNEVLTSLASAQSEGRAPQLESSVAHVLEMLCQDAMQLVTEAGVAADGSQLYSVSMLGCLEHSRMLQAQAAIRDKFGEAGLRIFNLLAQRGQLEQKTISEFGMLAQQETREALYRMLQSGFLSLQDIPRGSDRAPSRCFYTWRAELQTVVQTMAVDLYRAAGNVHMRLRYELDKHKEVLQLVDEAKAAGTMTFNLTPGQREQLRRLQRSTQSLEASMLRLDEMIALFNDF